MTLLAAMIREMAELLDGEDVVASVGADFETKLHQHLFAQPATIDVRILEVDGYPAGYCAFYMTFSTFRASPGLYLEDIYVRPHFRKLGVGRKMMQAICKIARSRGCCRVEWVAPARNRAVNEFYESLEVPVVTGWNLYRARDTISEMSEQAQFDSEELQ